MIISECSQNLLYSKAISLHLFFLRNICHILYDAARCACIYFLHATFRSSWFFFSSFLFSASCRYSIYLRFFFVEVKLRNLFLTPSWIYNGIEWCNISRMLIETIFFFLFLHPLTLHLLLFLFTSLTFRL